MGKPRVFLMSAPDAFYVAWEGDLRTTDLANIWVSLFLVSPMTSRVRKKETISREEMQATPG